MGKEASKAAPQVEFTWLWKVYQERGISTADVMSLLTTDALSAELTHDDWVKGLLQLLVEINKRKLFFLIEADVITRKKATIRRMNSVYDTYLGKDLEDRKKKHVQEMLTDLTKEALGRFRDCQWGMYTMRADRLPHCNKKAEEMTDADAIDSTDEGSSTGERRTGVWKRTEKEAIQQFGKLFLDQLNTNEEFKTAFDEFMTKYKRDMVCDVRRRTHDAFPGYTPRPPCPPVSATESLAHIHCYLMILENMMSRTLIHMTIMATFIQIHYH
eukprot:345003_1